MFKESDVLQRETMLLPERTSIFNKLKAPLSQKLNSTQPTSNIRVHLHCPQAKREEGIACKPLPCGVAAAPVVLGIFLLCSHFFLSGQGMCIFRFLHLYH